MKLDNILLIEPFQRFMIFFTHRGTLPRRKKGNIEINYKKIEGKRMKRIEFSAFSSPGEQRVHSTGRKILGWRYFTEVA